MNLAAKQDQDNLAILDKYNKEAEYIKSIKTN